MDLESVIKYITQKHANQTRKDGITPYVEHPISVAKILEEKGFELEYQITALLHDVLEDTTATYNEIVELTNKNIGDNVVLLTKQPGYVMKDYVGRIAKSPIARNVKLADRLHNLKESLSTSPEFREKYLKETYEWYIPLSKGTMFEKELQEIVLQVENSLKLKK